MSRKEEDRQAFLRWIRECPTDALRHFVYADWLNEQGEDDEAERQRAYPASEGWLRGFAAQCGQTCTNYGDVWREDAQESWAPITFEGVVQAGYDYLEHDDYFVQQGSETARSLLYEGDNRKEFWRHWQVATGVRVAAERQQDGPFSCSC